MATEVVKTEPSLRGPRLAGKPAAVCTVTFRPTPPTSLIFSCADGRFALEDPEVLRAIGVNETPDRQTPPGGPAALHLMGCEQHLDREIGFARLGFLIAHHHTMRLILVAHEDCGHYKAKYPQDDVARRMQRQLGHILEVASDLRKRFPGVTVECFYARNEREHVAVHAVLA